jgi:hypothetical protein
MATTEPLTEREQQALEQMREAPGAGIDAEGPRGEDRAGRAAALGAQEALGAQGGLRATAEAQDQEAPRGGRICADARGACGRLAPVQIASAVDCRGLS